MNKKDIEILRPLAARVREIAELPEMETRRKRWYAHNALAGERPMVLCFPEGAWEELLPDSALLCEDPLARQWEWQLRSKVYWWEHLRDDNALEPFFDISWRITTANETFGVDVKYTYGENRGSKVWKPPFTDLSMADIARLRYREMTVDRTATLGQLEMASRAFGDLLPSRIRGAYWWSMGLTGEAIKLIGIENLMVFMYTKPEETKALMQWLSEEHLHLAKWFESEGLLTLNNRADYTGSGGVAYTNELPKRTVAENEPARLKDLWGFAESQETVGISPQLFAEFVLPYQLPLLNLFGLTCYGCCEPMHDRIDYLADVKTLRRVSVAPTADQKVLGEKLKGRCIFSRKPQPSQVCVMFDEGQIRQDIRTTLSLAAGNAVEIIMKDTHTVEHQPWRLSRWVEIALEEANRPQRFDQWTKIAREQVEERSAIACDG